MSDFVKTNFNIAVDLAVYEPVSWLLDMLIVTTKLYIWIKVWRTLTFIESQRAARKEHLLAALSHKVFNQEGWNSVCCTFWADEPQAYELLNNITLLCSLVIQANRNLQTHARTHMRMHTHTHTHACAHTYTQTHTGSWIYLDIVSTNFFLSWYDYIKVKFDTSWSNIDLQGYGGRNKPKSLLSIR